MRPSCLFGTLGWSLTLVLPLIGDGAEAEAGLQQEPADSALEAIVASALESPQLAQMAAGLADTIGGRLSGTPDGDRAESWAARQLRSFGFDSVWQEMVPLPVWRRGASRVQIVAPASLGRRGLDAIAYGYSPGVDADSIPVVDMGRGDAAAISEAGRRWRGVALLTDVVSPEVIAAAAEVGVVALLRIAFEPGRLPQARVAPWEEAPAPVPILGLAREDGLWLRRQVAVGPVAIRLHVVAETSAGSATNVVAEWRGGDSAVSDEVVLLGAHLDAWDVGDGALDNGTGVLVVMGAAQAVIAGGKRPRRTLRVVLFAAEELGLRGSREYVHAHADELADIVAMMNLDMVGSAVGYGATGHEEADTMFAELVQLPQLRDLGLSSEVNHGGGAGSDHQHFLLAGVPTIYVASSLPPDTPRWYHNSADTLDKVDLEALKSSVAAAAAAAWALADHPGRPLRHLSVEETRHLIRLLGWVSP